MSWFPLLFGVAVLALVGVVLAALRDPMNAGKRARRPRVCPRCGRQSGRSPTCSGCGLFLDGQEAIELQETKAAVRKIRQLVARDELEGQAAETVVRALQRDLWTAAASVEKLFASDFDPHAASQQARDHAVALLEGLDRDDWDALSARALRGAARLFRSVGRTKRTVQTYDRLLQSRPDYPLLGEAALEAARYFAKLELKAEAVDAVRRALSADLSPGQRTDAEELLNRLSPPVEAAVASESVEILDVLPADPEPNTAVAEVHTEVVPPASPPSPPRRRRDLLSGFMEERNILWGELVGGLLIVGCSIALVVTLWSSLEEAPYFPFLLFTGITAALFGAGQYTLHHWKLTSTSRGLLVIAMLLAPLNLLTLADPSLNGVAGPGGLLDLVGKGAALLVFAVMTRRAGRDLLAADALPTRPDRRTLLTVAVVGAAGGPMLLAPWLDAGGTSSFALLAGWPLTAHVVALGAVVVGLRHAALRNGNRLTAPQSGAFFIFLGLSVFATAAALGFVVTHVSDAAAVLQRLALPAAVVGVPSLLGGLLVSRRADESGARAAGTGVGLAGAMVMLAAVALAWPRPGLLAAVCLLDGLLLTAVAFRYGLPSAHLAALPCLALVYLLGVLAATGELPDDSAGGLELAARLTGPTAALALTAFTALLAGVAECLVRFGRRSQAVSYAAAAATAGVTALLAATFTGAERPALAAVAYGVCGGVALAVNGRWRRTALDYVGLGLLVAMSLWTLHAAESDLTAMWGCVVAAEAAVLAALAVWSSAYRLHRACHDLAVAVGVLAVALAVVSGYSSLSPWHNGTLFGLMLAAFLLTAADRSFVWTIVGSVLGLAALVHAFVWTNGGVDVPRPYSAAFLAHAVIALTGAQFVRRRADWQAIWFRPLEWSALITSCVAAVLLLAPGGDHLAARSAYAFVLGLVWLQSAWSRRSPRLFTAFQGAVTVSLLFAVGRWLNQQADAGTDWFEPYRFQVYGNALAVLGLAWIAFRALLSRSRLDPSGVAVRGSVDHHLTALVVAGQFLLAFVVTAQFIDVELHSTSFRRPFLVFHDPAHALGPTAWLLVGTLAVTLSAGRWEGSQGATLFLAVLTMTAALLTAARFAEDHAVVSALRWGLAADFLLLAALSWTPAPSVDRRSVRGVGLVAATVVIGLTVAVASLTLNGQAPVAAAVGSFFDQIGLPATALAPLALIVVGLSGSGVRERRAGYAFAGGLVAVAAVVGGYALTVVTGGGAVDEVEAARLFQLGSLTAALWGLFWLATRPWLAVWREAPPADAGSNRWSTQLMELQVGLGVAGQFGLLGYALAAHGNVLVAPEPWALEAGSWLGGLSLTAALALFIAWQVQIKSTLAWQTPFFVGLTLPVYIACAAERGFTGSGPRVLLLAWPIYLLLWTLLPFTPQVARRLLPRVSLDWNELPFAVALTSCFTVYVAVHACQSRDDLLTAAAGAAITGAALASLAVGQRQPGLAFAAALTLNAVVSLVVGHIHRNGSFEEAWVPFAQANVVASAVAALAWLSSRRRIGLERSGAVLLALQSWLPLVSVSLLAAIPVIRLFVAPERPLESDLRSIGDWGGWLALLSGLAAAATYCRIVRPAWTVHAVGPSALAAGVLAACFASHWDVGDWTSFHVLSAIWATLGIAATAAGIVAPRHRRTETARWLEVATLGVVVLSLRGWDDPWRPYSSATGLLAGSFIVGTLAFWLHRGVYVYASGLLLNLAGDVCLVASGPESMTAMILVNALGLALASTIWTTIAVTRRWTAPFELPKALVKFEHLAATIALMLFLAVVVQGLSVHVAVEGGLAASAALALTAALIVGLWDRSARLAAAGLYGLGLGVVGLGLNQTLLPDDDLRRFATAAFAGYALLTAFIGRIAQRNREGLRRFGLPERDETSWFTAAQSLLGAVVCTLGTVLVFESPTISDRLWGPFAVALLTAAAILLVEICPVEWAAPMRRGVFGLAAFSLFLVAVAAPDPTSDAVWLHRNGLVLTTLAALGLLYDTSLARLLADDSPWAGAGRRVGRALSWTAALLVLILLAQEVSWYAPATGRTPLTLWEVGFVAVGLGGLMTACVRWAVIPGADPLVLSDRWRTIYVYILEVLLLVLFVQLRLNVPELFGSAMAKWWPLIVMVLAFAGVGLGEFFGRRGQPILAVPLQRTGLFLPLLPLLSFWARPPGVLVEWAADRFPGASPWIAAWRDAAPRYDRYALVLVLAGVMLAFLGAVRRSTAFGLAAVLAWNGAYWSLLANGGVAFSTQAQLWLIPPGLILLAVEQRHRDQLSAATASGLRYLGVCLIYLSATADLFTAGIGNSVFFPTALAALSVAGVLLGIRLRVRTFLFVGVAFLALDVLAMIWHAAVDRNHPWVWWVCGIALGVAVLMLFAGFEKRRNDVVRMLDDLRRWH